MKCCTKCGVEKPVEDFTTMKKSRDGRHPQCRACVNSYRRENQSRYRDSQKRWEIENADRILENARKRRATDRFKELSYVNGQRYRAKYGDRLREKKRAYYAAHPELRRAEYQRNKEAYIARAYKRHHNLRELTPANANRKVIQAFYDLAKRLTLTTGITYEVDHIVPISKGGLHHENNLRVVTMKENRSKGARLVAV